MGRLRNDYSSGNTLDKQKQDLKKQIYEAVKIKVPVMFESESSTTYFYKSIKITNVRYVRVRGVRQNEYRVQLTGAKVYRELSNLFLLGKLLESIQGEEDYDGQAEVEKAIGRN